MDREALPGRNNGGNGQVPVQVQVHGDGDVAVPLRRSQVGSPPSMVSGYVPRLECRPAPGEAPSPRPWPRCNSRRLMLPSLCSFRCGAINIQRRWLIIIYVLSLRCDCISTVHPADAHTERNAVSLEGF